MDEKEHSLFELTIFVLSEQELPEGFFLQICDDEMCYPAMCDENGVASLLVSCGDYDVKALLGEDELAHEQKTVTPDSRFCVVELSR